jgi:hypothetical protein
VAAEHLDAQLERGSVDIVHHPHDVVLGRALREEQRREHPDRPGAHRRDVVAGDVDGVPAGGRAGAGDRVAREDADLVAERDRGGVLAEPGVDGDVVAPHPEPSQDQTPQRGRVQLACLHEFGGR